MKCVRDMTRTYSQMHRTDKYSEHSSIIWPVWLSVGLRTKWFWVRVQLQSLKVTYNQKYSGNNSYVFFEEIENVKFSFFKMLFSKFQQLIFER